MQATFVGKPVLRLEDRPLVTGRGRFAADINFPHQLHMRVVRSTQSHGRIRSIDPRRALAHPGVVAVWTAADVADVPPIDLREGRIEQFEPYRQPILARDYVRYVGEPVAVVFAEEPLRRRRRGRPCRRRHRRACPSSCRRITRPANSSPAAPTEVTVIDKAFGDVEAALAAMHTAVIELELKIGRHSGVPLETRGVIARLDPVRDILEMHGAAKVPHRTRDLLAQTLERSPSSVHLFEGHTGGGFGIRGELYPEDVLVCLAALRSDGRSNGSKTGASI